MFETLSEAEGCDLLARVFRARGYAIVRNLQFREYGVEFHVDGWDAKARVGFEYLTSEDEDHDDLSLVEYKALMAEQRRGACRCLSSTRSSRSPRPISRNRPTSFSTRSRRHENHAAPPAAGRPPRSRQ